MGVGAIGWLLTFQVAQASVVGAVRDGASHGPLVGAIVVLGDLDRAATKGRYRFHRVPAGPHHLTIRAIEFQPRTLHGLVPREGDQRGRQ